VYPILAVVDELRKTGGADPADAGGRGRGSGGRGQESEVALCYVGEAGGAEEELTRRAGIPFRAIETGQVRGRSLRVALQSFLRMRRGAAQCRAILTEFRPDVVLLTGGYVAAPVAWTAWRMRVPTLIYLPDVTPGDSIRWTSRLATRVAVSFPEVTRYFGTKAVVTGYPVRQALFTTDRTAARGALGLRTDLPVLLVMGGSRGARSINRALEAALPTLLPRCQIVHISGTLDWPEVEKAAAALRSRSAQGAAGAAPSEWADRYHAYPYLHEMPAALAAADLGVARAGAATLAEFPAVGLPAILAPYPYSGQHQDANAAYLADRGAAVTLKDAELAARLAPTILGLLDAPERLAAMAKAARALSRPDAAANIADELYRLA
jgi:UDP-N-acetylglucosamine--N-acetylmuramyl-(pentapeptide) pyrophosphoryl-undecaprenol N-acetylglucosamine transferase